MKVYLFLVTLATIPATRLDCQSISGTVIEKASKLPVSGAAVILSDVNDQPLRAVVTDSLGVYRITAPSPGSYRISIQRIGLSPLRMLAVEVRQGRDTVINSEMTQSVATLPGVRIVEDRIVSAPPGNRHKYDEFLRRRRLGMGHFITRSDIESHARSRMPEVFNGIPGIKVREHGTRWYLQSQRCSGKSIPGLDQGAVGGRTSSGEIRDPKLDPMLFIDGFRSPDITALADLAPQQVEAIEIYQGASQLPAEARGDACFAIFIWLKG